jgi:hypothetical protein
MKQYFIILWCLCPPPPPSELLCWGAAAFFSLQLLEHHVLWLKNLFEVLKNFDVPVI